MFLVGINPELTHTTAQYNLGALGADNAGRVWVYVQAAATITAGMCCIIHGGYTAQGITLTLAAADAGYGKQCGVPVVAIASGSYGWLCVYGTGADILVDLTEAAADHTRLRATATAGGLNDTTTGTDPYIAGLVITTTSGGAEQEIAILTWPHVELDLLI